MAGTQAGRLSRRRFEYEDCPFGSGDAELQHNALSDKFNHKSTRIAARELLLQQPAKIDRLNARDRSRTVLTGDRDSMTFSDGAESLCRFCGTRLSHTFVDLGMSPLAESWVQPEDLNRMERFYPLHVYVCERCFLVQLEEFESPDHIFSNYAY